MTFPTLSEMVTWTNAEKARRLVEYRDTRNSIAKSNQIIPVAYVNSLTRAIWSLEALMGAREVPPHIAAEVEVALSHPNCRAVLAQVAQTITIEQESSEVGSIENRRRSLERRMDRIEAELARLDALPSEPVGEIAVVWFRKTHGNADRIWTYAATRGTDGLWYITGTRTRTAVGWSWDELMDFVSRDEPKLPGIWLATQVELIAGTDPDADLEEPEQDIDDGDGE